MGTYDFSYTVSNNSYPITTGTTTAINDTSTCTVWGCGCNGFHYYYWYPDRGYSWYPSPPVTKYLYQILCPKPGCAGKFWAEVDEIKKCPVCKSKIKITDKESDYEVAVNK